MWFSRPQTISSYPWKTRSPCWGGRVVGKIKATTGEDACPKSEAPGHSTSPAGSDEPANRCLLVRYEDLLENAQAQLRRIREFLRLDWDEERGRKAVEKSNFEKLQKQEAEKGFRERPAGVSSFFRKGEAGGWRKSLPPALARQIVIDHEVVMRRLGYSNDVEEVLGKTSST